MDEKTLGKERFEKEFKSRWAAFRTAAEEAGYSMGEDSRFFPALSRVLSCSEFVATAAAMKPAVVMELMEGGDLERSYSQGGYETALLRRAAGAGSPEELGTILRRFRLREMVRIAWRDLVGSADLSETMGDLSDLAEACIRCGVSFLHRNIAEKMGRPSCRKGFSGEMVVMGMGKLGAGELNFSSDIDLIFAYPETGETQGAGRQYTNGEFYSAVARAFNALFGGSSAEGILFRVDLRLRPYGESGPLVMSFDAMENYYQEQGREWERYAMIKARVVGGDLTAGKALLARLAPFVYRRYLDYGVFDALREMKRSIALEVEKRGLSNNIKIGGGGIREIEFFGQIFQLIRGGVIPRLRERKILRVLEALAAEKMVPEQVTGELAAAYRFLRNTEHRLQEYADLQTHELPADPAGQYRLAFSMGFDDWDRFYETLQGHRKRVHAHFDSLLVEGEEEQETRFSMDPSDAEETRRFLEQAGFTRPDLLIEEMQRLFTHPSLRGLSTRGKGLLLRILPVMVNKAAEAQDPEIVMVRLMELLRSIGRRTTYLSLLLEKPEAMTHLVKLSRKSPWIIEFLSRHPVLLDELLDPRTLYRPPERAELEREIELRTAGFDDVEYRVEALCVFKQANLLRVAAADVTGAYPLMRVSDRLTDIAEVIIEKVLTIARQALVLRHGTPGRGGGFCVVAYGKLGGIELGYGSDLDLVFLHGGGDALTSGGERPINTGEFYVRLGQRMAHLLSAHTPAGMLYETDMRLRPSGISGILVSHMDAFREYQEEKAWTWEHQALVRARVVAGDPGMAELFDGIRRDVLTRQRKEKPLKEEVRNMREKLRKKRLSHDPGQFDLKEDRGGIVDIEFLVQYITLLSAAAHPELVRWTDNVRLLDTMVDAGILEKRSATLLKSAYLFLRAKVHSLSLQNRPAKVPACEFQDLREEVIGMWDRFLGEQQGGGA